MTGAHPPKQGDPGTRRKPPLPLRAYLTRLVWLSVLPLFLLAAGFGVSRIRAIQSRMDRDISDRSHNVMTSIDRIVHSQIAALQVLAASPLLDDPKRRGEFYREARGFLDSFGCHVLLADPSTRILLYTKVAYGGSPLPKLPPPAKGGSAVQVTLEKGVPTVSNLTVGSVSRELLVAAIVPVQREGRTLYLLISVIPTRLFQQHLDTLALPKEWTLLLLDGNDDGIARRGQPTERDRSSGTNDVRRFPKKSSESNWSFVIEVPAAAYRAPIHVAAIALVSAILFFTLVSVLAGRLAGSRLTRAVKGLANPSLPAPGSTSIAEFETVRSLLEEAAAATKAAESTLRESEERYRSLFDAAPVAIGVFCEDRVVFANPAAVRMFGAESADRLIGKSIKEILPPDAYGRSRARMERMFAGETGVYPAEEVLRKLDGTEVHAELMASPVAYEGKTAIQVIVSDITGRKRAEEALRKSEALFRNLFQGHSAVMLLLDPDNGAILDANKAAAEFYGWPQERLREMRIQEINTLPPEEVLEEIEKVKSRKRIHFEFRHRRADGSVRDVEVFSSEIEAQGRKILHSIIHDVTERAQLEAQFLHAQKMESIGTLAGGVAHDFNNILTAIIGYGHLALMEMAEGDPLRQNVLNMLEAADRAAHLTQELLLFSRKQSVERRPVDLNDVVRKVEKFLRRVIGEDIECLVSPGAAGGEAAGGNGQAPLPEERLSVLADPLQIEQVLMNLATNARDAMPRGGILSLKTSRIYLGDEFVSAHGFGKAGPYALLTVSDTGQGMDAGTLRHIFEPFYTTKETGKGTGLGLAVAYGIVKQHDGFINAYSEPGHGTTFRIYLPIHSQAPAEPVPEPPKETIPEGTETILVAEDDGALREIAKTVLSMHGYTVIEAADGEEAVRKFREHRDDVRLLLMDLIMPKMDGKEACDAIRKIRPDVKVLFSTGYAPDHLRQKLRIEGPCHLIQKPVSPVDLLRKVRSLLDGGD